MVPRVRFELTRPFEHYALNVARLPFRHLGVFHAIIACQLMRVKRRGAVSVQHSAISLSVNRPSVGLLVSSVGSRLSGTPQPIHESRFESRNRNRLTHPPLHHFGICNLGFAVFTGIVLQSGPCGEALPLYRQALWHSSSAHSPLHIHRRLNPAPPLPFPRPEVSRQTRSRRGR